MSTEPPSPQEQVRSGVHRKGSSRAAPEVLHAVIPAAGLGQRFDPQSEFKPSKAKQYHELAGKAVIVHSVQALLKVQSIACVWVVLAPGDREGPQLLAQELLKNPQRLQLCLQGGTERRDSVLAGLMLAQKAAARWVLVHDAARPLVAAQSLKVLIETCLQRQQGGILALPVVDTVKRAQLQQGEPLIEQTISRERLWLAQTPQLFPTDRLIHALERFPEVTDESSAMEQLGEPVMLIKGERSNMKLTYAEDLRELEMYLSPSTASHFRVGEGYDVHALVPGRSLMIGGVRIDYPLGLLGHSDADVLLHAITDALIGAAGLGDIGLHFPDHEQTWHQADSRVLLSKTAAMLRERKWSIANLDCTVIAQRPRLSPYRDAIVQSIASCLAIEPAKVNFKAKTQEWLGFEGRGEGMSARAVVMIEMKAGQIQAGQIQAKR